MWLCGYSYVDMWMVMQLCGYVGRYVGMWLCGYVVMVMWICGDCYVSSMQVSGYVVMWDMWVWLCGYVDMWLCKCVDMWIYGYVGMW